MAAAAAHVDHAGERRADQAQHEARGSGGDPRGSELEGVFAPDFRTGEPNECAARLDAVRTATRFGADGWYSERFAIWVAFDDENRVTAVASCPAQRFEESIWNKLRRRLRL